MRTLGDSDLYRHKVVTLVLMAWVLEEKPKKSQKILKTGSSKLNVNASVKGIGSFQSVARKSKRWYSHIGFEKATDKTLI